MIRRLACFSSALLLTCGTAFAQNAAPVTQPPAAGIASTTSPEIVALQKVEDSWSAALNSRDQYGLELVISPLYVGISANGDVTTHNQQIAQVINGDDKTFHLEQRVITVRMLGDVAVANGTYKLHRKADSGTGEVNENGVFTHVFQRVHNNWLCINSQRTLLREDIPGANKAKKKPSDAELPFHIPIFTKDK